MRKEQVFSRKLLCFLFMIVFSSSAVLYAQGGGKVRVKGHVSDVNQELLIGVSIQEKGTSNGIITDVNGGFSLEVSPKATLVVSYVGYATQEFPIKNQTDFDIVLQEDAQLLNEMRFSRRHIPVWHRICKVKLQDCKSGNSPVSLDLLII